jgi:hypothetical protein
LKESKKTTINCLGTVSCAKLTSHLPLVGDGEHTCAVVKTFLDNATAKVNMNDQMKYNYTEQYFIILHALQ